MKVIHKNSQEIYTLLEPLYTKLNGMYGYLVVMDNRVFYITQGNDEVFSEEVTDDFTVLIQ